MSGERTKWRRALVLSALGIAAALAGFAVLTGRAGILVSSDADYWCKVQFPEHSSFKTAFEPLPFRARGLEVGLLECTWSPSLGGYAYVGLPSSRRGALASGVALWPRIEGPPRDRARAAVTLLVGEAIRYQGLALDETCPVAPQPDGALRFCAAAAGFPHRWRCIVEPSGSFGCSLRSPQVDLVSMCRRHGAKEPVQAHESEIGELISSFPIVPLKGGASRLVGWTPSEISTATVQCTATWDEKPVVFGWDATGRLYEAAELARLVRGDVAKRAALVSTLLLPPWKASDGWILASDKDERCGDLNSPLDDDEVFELNTVSKLGPDGSEQPPTFAKCRIDVKTGRAGCVPKDAHPCAEARF